VETDFRGEYDMFFLFASGAVILMLSVLALLATGAALTATWLMVKERWGGDHRQLRPAVQGPA
jgi:hypothetical protein